MIMHGIFAVPGFEILEYQIVTHVCCLSNHMTLPETICVSLE